LADVKKLSASFRFTLLNMLHSRIAYPTEEDKPQREETQSKALA
jgi:membrane-associated HD superfamily phosphohydrolase